MIQVLKSGNLLKWERYKVGQRGAATAVFSSPPSKADMDEGNAFLAAQIPEKARLVFAGSLGDRDRAIAALDEHLRPGVSRN